MKSVHRSGFAMLRSIAALALLSLGNAALAQSVLLTSPSSSTQQVQLLAPQLVAFAGSSGNFQSLVTGLTSGAPVTLTTVGADGLLQIVTFLPGTALSPLDAARVLETARQNLIGRGIAAPTAQQLAASLMGGTIATPSGTVPITGLLTGTTTPLTPVQVRTESTLAQRPDLVALRNALAAGSGITLVNTDGTGRNVTFPQTGKRMSDFEVNQSLQLAAALLAQQGILNPTADQLRVALFGGSIVTASGNAVPLQGVLQGRAANTSDSRILNTSASAPASTSASPLFGTSNTSRATGAAAAGGTAAPAAAPAQLPTRPANAPRLGSR